MVTITVSEEVIYEDLLEFEWRKYQKGMLGILNNAYNQSCNSGTKRLGNMSEITSEFDGGSYEDFILFYKSEYNGKERVAESIGKMATNLVSRIESVGGEIDPDDALLWSEKYINYMLVNSYRGFMAEEKAIEMVANEMGVDWSVAPPEKESVGIDGYINGQSVQVKPETHTSLDINDYDAELLIVYEYDDGEFTVSCEGT